MSQPINSVAAIQPAPLAAVQAISPRSSSQVSTASTISSSTRAPVEQAISRDLAELALAVQVDDEVEGQAIIGRLFARLPAKVSASETPAPAPVAARAPAAAPSVFATVCNRISNFITAIGNWFASFFTTTTHADVAQETLTRAVDAVEVARAQGDTDAPRLQADVQDLVLNAVFAQNHRTHALFSGEEQRAVNAVNAYEADEALAENTEVNAAVADAIEVESDAAIAQALRQ